MYKSILTFVIVNILAACSARVISFINDDIPFQNLEKYSIVNTKIRKTSFTEDELITITTIENSIKQELSRRDYIEDRLPNIIVRWELIANQETGKNFDNYNTNGIFYNPYYPSNRISPIVTENSVLMIEIIISSNNKIVWQASTDIDKYSDSKNKDRIIQTAVSNIFNTYLYRANQTKEDITLKSGK